MNQPAPPTKADAFLASLHDRSASGVSTISLDGGELPVSVHLQESSSLVFTFSGAVHRNHNQLPRFTATNLHQYVSASVIALSDPSLAQSDDLKLAWYSGHEGFPLQQILPDLLRRAIDSLNATRVAFVGSSGGGFAALYYSWQIPGSVAIVSNPQTHLNHAIQHHRGKYRDDCWPSLDKRLPLSVVVEVDLSSLYARRCDNSVIYLQEASDFFHLKWHFAPFMAALPREYAARLIVRTANWGQRGHHPVPTNIWIPWMRAALSAPETSAESIEETWAEQNPYQPHPLERLTPTLSRDAQIAAELSRTATRTVLGPHSSEESPL